MRAPVLPGLAFDPDAGYAYDRLPKIRRRIRRRSSRLLYDELMAHYVAPGWGLRLKNRELKAALGWSEGHIQRELAILAGTVIPGTDTPFITIVVTGSVRRIYLNTPPMGGRAQGRAGAPLNPDQGRAGAPLNGSGKSTQTLVPQAVPPTPPPVPFEKILFETNNVHVESLGEKPRAREAPPVAGPVEGVGSFLPGDPDDGVDHALAGTTTDELRGRVDALEARYRSLANHGSVALRVQARLELAEARALLEAREGPQEPRTTPKVESIGPRPAVAPAATPGPPKPASMQTLIGRLSRVAGPRPAEEFAERMAEDLKDGQSVAFYRRVAADVRAGRISPQRVLDGYRKARSGTCDRPGAVFNGHVYRRE